jgi:hypothetical protein
MNLLTNVSLPLYFPKNASYIKEATKMKMLKRGLFAAILAVCICPQIAHAEIANTLELRGQKDPALAGIDINNLTIKLVGDANTVANSQALRGIEALAQNRIRKTCSGMSVSSSGRKRKNSDGKPALRIDIRIVDLDNDSSVCFVQTRLCRDVRLPDDNVSSFEAVVWETMPFIETFRRIELREELEKIVDMQAKNFAHSCITSNSQLLSENDAQDEPEQTEQAQSTFVASKNSQVFHKPGCPFAQKIVSKNVVSYESRDAAVAAGKRPCKSCNP